MPSLFRFFKNKIQKKKNIILTLYLGNSIINQSSKGSRLRLYVGCSKGRHPITLHCRQTSTGLHVTSSLYIIYPIGWNPGLALCLQKVHLNPTPQRGCPSNNLWPCNFFTSMIWCCFLFFFLKLGDISLFGQIFNDVFSESILAKLLCF